MNWITATLLVYAACAALYLLLSALILTQPQARHSGTGLFLAGACLVTAAWAGSVALILHFPGSLVPGLLDLARSLAWLGFIAHLYRRAVPGSRQRRQALGMLGLVACLAVAVTILLGTNSHGIVISLGSVLVVGRLGLSVCAVLLIENLYMNTSDDAKWHISLPCVALGALSIYDIALSADALLFRHVSTALVDGRAMATAMVAPLLAIAAVRNRRSWNVDIYVSRSVVFHSATLVMSGVFLLGLVVAGQAISYIGADWGGVAEISLIFGGLLVLAVLVTSRSSRSRVRNLIVDHFFTHRYDYRREWMRCIATLSAPDAYVALHTRVIRAVAEIVDSPGGILFLRESGETVFQWAGSWNMPAASLPVMPDHPLVTGFRGGDWIIDLASPRNEAGGAAPEIPDGVPPGIHVAVPLVHGDRLIGFILTVRPRATFKLDREVFDLLRIVGRQVAANVAEQRATEVLMQTRELHEYGKRFAFVAHDIKNVSSQLSLLLSNAEVHLENPEFQADMLTTIRASVQKIGALIKRLTVPETALAQSMIIPAERLETIVTNNRRARGMAIELVDDGHGLGVAMGAAAFDAVVTHVLDNAIEAIRGAEVTAGPGDQVEPAPVRIVLHHEARRVMIDIIDQGVGMTPEFIRNGLFTPFRTSKPEGSGIGAFQARELLREAGGDLIVMSQTGTLPGTRSGTTMRLLLPLVEAVGRES